MQIKNMQEYSHTVHGNDLITCVYIPLFLVLLYYNNLLLTVWSFDNIILIMLVAVTEVIKYIIYANREGIHVGRTSFKDFFKGLFAMFSIFIMFFVLTILFGAPAFSLTEETCVFSLILTTLTALPVCLHFGPRCIVQMFLSLTSYEGTYIQELFMLKMRLTILGAWLGAIVIPLDWNRPWQDWPIPCCIGTFIGYAVANCVTSLLQLQQRGKLFKKTGKYTL